MGRGNKLQKQQLRSIVAAAKADLVKERVTRLLAEKFEVYSPHTHRSRRDVGYDAVVYPYEEAFQASIREGALRYLGGPMNALVVVDRGRPVLLRRRSLRVKTNGASGEIAESLWDKVGAPLEKTSPHSTVESLWDQPKVQKHVTSIVDYAHEKGLEISNDPAPTSEPTVPP